MQGANIDEHEISLVVSLDELRMLNNALNEVVHGSSVPAQGFEGRMGDTRESFQALLAEVHSVLCAAEEYRPRGNDRRD
jgi:hypothetical protein